MSDKILSQMIDIIAFFMTEFQDSLNQKISLII